MKTLGRLVVRRTGAGENLVGTYWPTLNSELSGIYEIREFLGELYIVRVGESHIHPDRLNGATPEELRGEKPYLTAEEFETVEKRI